MKNWKKNWNQTNAFTLTTYISAVWILSLSCCCCCYSTTNHYRNSSKEKKTTTINNNSGNRQTKWKFVLLCFVLNRPKTQKHRNRNRREFFDCAHVHFEHWKQNFHSHFSLFRKIFIIQNFGSVGSSSSSLNGTNSWSPSSSFVCLFDLFMDTTHTHTCTVNIILPFCECDSLSLSLSLKSMNEYRRTEEAETEEKTTSSNSRWLLMAVDGWW